MFAYSNRLWRANTVGDGVIGLNDLDAIMQSESGNEDTLPTGHARVDSPPRERGYSRMELQLQLGHRIDDDTWERFSLPASRSGMGRTNDAITPGNSGNVNSQGPTNIPLGEFTRHTTQFSDHIQQLHLALANDGSAIDRLMNQDIPDDLLYSLFPDKKETWKKFDAEPHAGDYHKYVSRLIFRFNRVSGTSAEKISVPEYYKTRLNNIFDAIENNKPLREKCFEKGAGRFIKCIDNQFVGLYEQEKLVGSDELIKSQLDLPKLFEESLGYFKMDSIEEYSSAYALDQRQPYESLEFFLHLQNEVAGDWKMPFTEKHPENAHLFKVAPADVEKFKEQTLEREKGEALTGFLIKFEPWQEGLLRTYPEEHAVAQQQIREKKEIIEDDIQSKLDALELFNKNANSSKMEIDQLSKDIKELNHQREHVEEDIMEPLRSRWTQEYRAQHPG